MATISRPPGGHTLDLFVNLFNKSGDGDVHVADSRSQSLLWTSTRRSGTASPIPECLSKMCSSYSHDHARTQICCNLIFGKPWKLPFAPLEFALGLWCLPIVLVSTP